MKLRHHFDNDEVGLMLMKLGKQQLSEAEDVRARALLTLTGEMVLRNSQNMTRAVTLAFMLGFGMWFGQSAYASVVDFSTTWRIIGTMFGSICGLGFGYYMSAVAHYLYDRFVLGIQ